MINFDKLIRRQVIADLDQFNQMNYHDPLVAGLIMGCVLTILADIQLSYDQFDGEAEFEYDPEPYLEIKWWEKNKSFQGAQIIRFRFEPIRIEEQLDDAIAAYDRAMGVL